MTLTMNKRPVSVRSSPAYGNTTRDRYTAIDDDPLTVKETKTWS